MGIGILVTGVGNEVDVFLALGHVWSENLPVIASVLELNLALEALNEVLTSPRRTSEESHLGIGLLQDLLHDWTIRVDEVQVLLGHATVVQHANPLLKHDGSPRVSFNKRLVSHVKSTHHLEHGDLNWEIEGSNHTDWSVGEPVRRVELS